MKQKLLIALAILVGVTVTGLLVAASIWPVINEVETGKTPEYPEVQPQYYTTDPQRVFEEATGAVEELGGWTLANEDTASYLLEAERETNVFGFIDDVTIRVEPVTEFVTRVHVKSTSRVGKGDFGQNARNIEEFFVELDQRLGAVKFDPEKLRTKQNEAKAAPQRDANADKGGKE